jgi:hypothetical protein
MTEQRYRRSPAALSRTVGSEVLLASTDRESFDVLPGTAATIWALLGEPTSTRELADELASLYDVPAERAAADMGSLLEELLERGWVERIR